MGSNNDSELRIENEATPMKRLQPFLPLLFLLAGLILISCQSQPPREKHYQSFASAEALQDYLSWSPEKPPLISAHRGGPMPGRGGSGFPENCLETFENALSYAPCLIECDVRKSADGQLFLMHDETLNRTTTGSGPVAAATAAELQRLFLTDAQGRVTPYRIPTLAEALEWARGKAILTLDVKPEVSPGDIVAMIAQHRAESYVTVITYNLETAHLYQRLNPNLVISAPAQGLVGVQRLLASGIPAKNLMGFVGVYEPPPQIYDLLHQQGIRAILGTIGNLDRKAEKQGAGVYVELLKNGADVLATDNVALAGKAIEKYMRGR